MRVYKFLNRKIGAKVLREKRLKISELGKVNDPYELRPFKFTNPAHSLAVEATRYDQAKQHGIMCFSKQWYNPVIWSHYAENHNGLCLGFDIPDDSCKEVVYVNELLSFNEPLNVHAPASSDTVNQMLFTKFADWKYEQEVRMWATIKEREADGNCYYEFSEPVHLAEVIIGAGCNIVPDCIQRLVGPYTFPVQVIKARRSATQFEMEVETAAHREFDQRVQFANRFTEQLEAFSITFKRPRVVAGRNDRCPCGSDRKYKKCHGA